VRYLQPPTPPVSGAIIVREKQPPAPPPDPPLVITHNLQLINNKFYSI